MGGPKYSGKISHTNSNAFYMPPQSTPSDMPYVLPHLRGLSLSKHFYAPREVWVIKSHPCVTEKKTSIGFLDLAGEVRNKIYRYSLTAQCKNPQRCVWSGLGPHEGRTYSFALGLLRVNRQVYQEASSIFYRENGFVAIRDTRYDLIGHNFLSSILQRNVPAIAVTSKASECDRMAMIYQFGDCDIKPNGYLGIQIVLAAKDFELFALIVTEMSFSKVLPLGVTYSVNATEGLHFSSEAARQELLIGVNVFKGFKMMLTDESCWQQLPQGCRFMDPWNIDCQTLSERVEAKVADGSYPSAAFYFQRMEEYWFRLLSRNRIGHWGRCALPVIKWKRRHAEALRKAGHYRRAHRVVRSAISMWQYQDVPGMTHKLRSEIFCLRAQLDETQGSLPEMRNAVFWFSEALRYDPENISLKDNIKRIEQEILVLDTSNIRQPRLDDARLGGAVKP